MEQLQPKRKPCEDCNRRVTCSTECADWAYWFSYEWSRVKCQIWLEIFRRRKNDG